LYEYIKKERGTRLILSKGCVGAPPKGRESNGRGAWWVRERGRQRVSGQHVDFADFHILAFREVLNIKMYICMYVCTLGWSTLITTFLRSLIHF